MREIGRVLRPGGIACVATELILDGGPHEEFFTWEDLDRWVIRPSGLVPVERLDTRNPPDFYMDDPVRLPDEYLKTPHIVLAIGKWRFTSIMLFLRKPTHLQLLLGLLLRLRRSLTHRVPEADRERNSLREPDPSRWRETDVISRRRRRSAR